MKAEYDVAIIGGGVVGCAILSHLTNKGYQCILMEKEPHLISGASCGNSGHMIDTLLDGDFHSLEAYCLIRSKQYMKRILTKYNIPWQRVNSIMVAWTRAELDRLPQLVDKAHSHGIHDACLLSAAEIYQLEPNLSCSVLGGALIPGEALIDSWLLPVSLAHQALRLGSKVRCSCKVINGQHSNHWELTTTQGVITAQAVINAAGLYGDIVEEIAQPSSFKIKPRRGQFVVYSKEAGQLIKHMLVPLPKEKTKGIIIFPSVYGNLVIGPTAEDVTDRSKPQTTEPVLQSLIEYGQKAIRGLDKYKPIGSYAGVRPATDEKDYHIKANKDKAWITVGGIRSTGVSACLGIAEYVHQLLQKDLGLVAVDRPAIPVSSVSGWITSKPSVVLDGAEYHITHPLMRYGLAEEKIKSKL